MWSIQKKGNWVRHLDKRAHFVLLAEHERFYPDLTPDLRTVLEFVRRKASSSLNEIHELDRQVKGLRSAIDSPENRDAREVIDARVQALITMHEDLELLILRVLKTNPPKPLSPPDRARIVRVVDDPHVLEVVSALTRDDTRAGETAGFGRLARTGGLLRHRH
jgi:hypothetical protein